MGKMVIKLSGNKQGSRVEEEGFCDAGTVDRRETGERLDGWLGNMGIWTWYIF